MLKRFRGGLAALAVVALVAAGCGGDDDDPTSEERPLIEDGEEPTATAAPDAVAAPTPTAVPAEIEVPRLTYTVESGDLLGDIAATFGVPLGAIIAVNDMANPDLIQIGQEIVIPTEEEVAEWQAEQDAAEPEPETEPAADG